MTSAAPTMVSLFGHDPATYRPHAIHTGERNYLETNCFTDIISELLHARGDEPVASFGSFVRMDFENDQWTFFKPRPEDMELLYGVDIHEIQPYRSDPSPGRGAARPRPDDDDRARRLVSPGHGGDELSDGRTSRPV